MKKVLLVYNPISGNRNVPKKLDYIVGRLLEKDMLAIPFRMERDNGALLERVLSEDEYAYVIVSGGDGTVNMLASILLTKKIDIPIGIIPAGTCNDFARSLNLPTNLRKCLDIILEGDAAKIDAGLINNKKYCLNTCAGGNLVDVSYNTNPESKKNFGPLAYYVKALGEVSNLKPIKLKLTADEETVEGDFLLFLILNGKHAAGLSNIVGTADISDGYMDIVLVKNCLHVEIPGLLFKVLNNDFINDKNVKWIRTSKCTIEGDQSFNLSVDGEEWESLPITIEFFHQVLKVFVK